MIRYYKNNFSDGFRQVGPNRCVFYVLISALLFFFTNYLIAELNMFSIEGKSVRFHWVPEPFSLQVISRKTKKSCDLSVVNYLSVKL